ncbi:hypothetical protein RIF29_15163 [Crotalaria pallida]|uniref:Uncharacterized protein n=1 Tax=Crotalaria pallida TaxID=3830 RepID=A0AAN9IIZ0_CROPI
MCCLTMIQLLHLYKNTLDILRDRHDRDDYHKLNLINNIVKNLVIGFNKGLSAWMNKGALRLLMNLDG